MKQKTVEETKSLNKKKTRILFVDDEQNILDGIKRSLHYKTDEWELSFFSDANKAHEKILQTDHDIVVSDIKMPGMTGLEILEDIKSELKEKSPEFIMITGTGDKELKRSALNLDATDLLNKPIQKEDLIARINNAIRLKDSKDELFAQNILLEQQVIQSQKMETVGLMASGVAHDFNNILTVISNYSQLLEMLAQDNPAIKTKTDKIQKASGHGQRIIQQLLNFVRKKDVSFEKISLNMLIAESVELLKVSLSKQIDIQFSAPEEDISIMADYTQIFQIIMNLCLNAANAMNDTGRIIIDLTTGHPKDQNRSNQQNVRIGPCAIMAISDNGPGMDDAFKAKLESGLSSIKTSQNGTGLGLTIVQRIVKNHSGLLFINSKAGNGTTFYIYLPLAKTKF